MAIDIIGSYRKWSLLTAPPIILGGIIGTVIVCNFLFRKTGAAPKPQLRKEGTASSNK